MRFFLKCKLSKLSAGIHRAGFPRAVLLRFQCGQDHLGAVCYKTHPDQLGKAGPETLRSKCWGG